MYLSEEHLFNVTHKIPKNLTEQEVVTKINESKKAVAKKTKKGVRVKQSLNG